MSTSFRIHVPSALVGAAVLGLVVLLPGMQSLQTVPAPRPQFHPVGSGVFVAGLPLMVEVVGIPRAEDMMRVLEGAPFVVPSDKRFVVTGAGATSLVVGTDGSVRVFFDGLAVLDATWGLGGPATVPPGLVAGPGVTVTVNDAESSDGVGYGYLEDAG